MQPVFWLMLFLGNTAVHVGNFPTMASCQDAAKSSWTATSGGKAGFSVGFICVQANKGGSGDPSPPVWPPASLSHGNP